MFKKPDPTDPEKIDHVTKTLEGILRGISDEDTTYKAIIDRHDGSIIGYSAVICRTLEIETLDINKPKVPFYGNVDIDSISHKIEVYSDNKGNIIKIVDTKLLRSYRINAPSSFFDQ